jgi:hypothetical protein
MKAWVAMEENIAKLFGGKRIKRTNFGRSDVDIITEDYIIECKSRKEMPALLRHAWEQVTGYLKKYPDKIPLIALHQSRKRGYGKYFIVIEISDFLKLINNKTFNKEGGKTRKI